MLITQTLARVSLYHSLMPIDCLVPGIGGLLGITKRSIDIVVTEKSATRLRANIVQGIEFDDDIRQVAVVPSACMKDADRDLVVVAFHGSNLLKTFL